MSLRPFGETLGDLMEAIQPAGIAGERIRVTDACFDLPLEATLRGKGNDAEFLGDLPGWRWRTVFDLPRGRMHVRYELGDSL
jgi:hypothetical protein